MKTKTFLTGAQLAKLIRKDLKETFPGEVNKVRTGNISVIVAYRDEEHRKTLVKYLEKFRSRNYNPATGLEELSGFEYKGQRYESCGTGVEMA